VGKILKLSSLAEFEKLQRSLQWAKEKNGVLHAPYEHFSSFEISFL